MQIGKWIVFGVMALLIGAIVFSVYFASEGWEDGAPEASVTVTIQEINGEMQTFEGTVEIKKIEGNTASVMRPATAYTADIPALNPNGVYKISFVLTATFDTNGEAISQLSGTMGNGHPATWDSKSDREILSDIETTSQNQASVFEFESPSDGIDRYYTHYYDGSVYQLIRGSNVDGSVFDLTVEAEGINTEGAWSVGTTSATITIQEGTQGTITITIDNIETNVEGA